MNTEKIKKFYWWILVVLFFITTSWILFYAFGYQFNKERGIFVHSGSITLKTNPLNVSVDLNDSEISRKKNNRINNSYHIDRIKPGDYVVTVQADGYKSWSKKITIHSGLSTEFWNVTLARELYEINEYNSQGITNYFISPRKNLIAYTTQTEDDFSVWILDPESNSSKKIYSSDSFVFTPEKDENIEWSPDTKKLIIPMQSKNQNKRFFIVDTETKEVIDLKEQTGTKDMLGVRWDPEEKNVYYYLGKGNLYRMDLNEDKDNMKTKIADGVSGYDISDSLIFYYQTDSGLVFQTNMKGTDSPKQVTTNIPSEMVGRPFKIIVYDENRIVFFNKNIKELYIFNEGENKKYFEKLSSKALGSQFSNDGKKLLFWDEREIFVHFLRRWETQPYRDESTTNSITRFSQPIENVQWASDYEHVLFTVDKNLKLIELDHRDHRNTQDIISITSKNQKITNDMSEGKIYFIENQNENSSILKSIDFPEDSLGILGM